MWNDVKRFNLCETIIPFDPYLQWVKLIQILIKEIYSRKGLANKVRC